jgi:hypothetical protein
MLRSFFITCPLLEMRRGSLITPAAQFKNSPPDNIYPAEFKVLSSFRGSLMRAIFNSHYFRDKQFFT